MNKRTFIKSLFATGVIALVPTKLFAQQKKQSTINGIPVNIYDCTVSSESSLVFPDNKYEIVARVTVDNTVKHNLYDKLSVVFVSKEEQVLAFSGTVDMIIRYDDKIIYCLKNCQGKLILERCMVV